MINGFVWIRNLAVLTAFIVLGWSSARAVAVWLQNRRGTSDGDNEPSPQTPTIADNQRSQFSAELPVLTARSPYALQTRPEILIWTAATAVVTQFVAQPREPVFVEARKNSHSPQNPVSVRLPASDYHCQADVLHSQHEWSRS